MTTAQPMSVTRPWLIAFAASAMVAPISFWILGAIIVRATFDLREWLAGIFYAALVCSFTGLLIKRERFCALSPAKQRILAILAILLLLIGYALVLKSVQRTA